MFPLRRALLCLLLAAPLTLAAAEHPNILFILADDLGYGDMGPFWQDALRDRGDRSRPWHLTPELTAMAGSGLRLHQHYCPAPVCAPSRASLLLGVHQGHANVRDNQFDKALEHNHTLATVLHQAGYSTAAIGKWGLQGGPAEKSPEAAKAGPDLWPGFPTKRGFDYYYGYIRHGDGHWHYPKEDGRQVWEGEREVSADLAGCYTTDLFTARAKKWIADEHSAHPEKPFFLYLAYDTPHAKLQLPPAPYPAGGGAKGGLQWLGKPGGMINTAGGTPDSFMHPDYAGATWDHDHDPATPEQPWPDVYRRFATDVRRIDDCVGDLLTLLRDLGIDRDTLVIFTTDNGPSQESYLPQAYEADFFHSFGPYDGIKRDCWEGGMRVGALAAWPGHIAPGRVSENPSQFHDWMPTFAELAGVPAPARTDGVSLVPTLTGQGHQLPSRVYVEYSVKGKTPAYEAFAPVHRGRVRGQMQVLKLGDYTGVRYNVTDPAAPFEIYRVQDDPREEHDFGARPELAALQREMHETVLRIRRPDATARRPWDDLLVPALAEQAAVPGLEWRAYTAALPWVSKLEWLTPSTHGTAATFTPDSAQPAAPSRLYTGFLRVPEEGSYTFHLDAPGGALLRVHEATVIDGDRTFGKPAENTGTILLGKGLHPIRLYVKAGAEPGSVPLLRWSRSGQPPTEIPAEALCHALEPVR